MRIVAGVTPHKAGDASHQLHQHQHLQHTPHRHHGSLTLAPAAAAAAAATAGERERERESQHSTPLSVSVADDSSVESSPSVAHSTVTLAYNIPGMISSSEGRACERVTLLYGMRVLQ